MGQKERLLGKLGVVWYANPEKSLTELLLMLHGRTSAIIIHKFEHGATDYISVGQSTTDFAAWTDEEVEEALNELLY